MTATVSQSLFVVPAIAAVARNLGFFQEAGIEVVDVMTPSSTAQHADLDAGRVDVAITATDNLFAWNAGKTSDIVQIAQLEKTTDQVLMLRPGLPSLAAAATIRLAVDAPGNGFAILAYAMLRRLGYEPESYQVAAVGGVRARYQTLSDGQCDLTLLAPPLDEAGAAHGMTPLMRAADLAPGYPGLGVVARRAALSGGDGPVHAYLRALERARRWIRSESPETVAAQLGPAGHGPRAVASAIELNPPSLKATSPGLEVLAALRSSMDMLIPGAPSPESLVLADPGLLAALG